MLPRLRKERTDLSWGLPRAEWDYGTHHRDWTKFLCLLGCELSYLYSDLGDFQ